MISILIPVYNFTVVELVADLHSQATEAGIDFEIRCYDDESDKLYKERNQVIDEWSHVVYKELPENLGRSRIRHLLATDAAFDLLLFSDCDARTTHPEYIKKYLDFINYKKSSNIVIYGGHTYPEYPPAEFNGLLHWTYGKTKDQQPADVRVRKPYLSFKTINFVISRHLFLENQPSNTLEGYGHEDTLMGLMLQNKGVPIFHIDNPLCHLGLVDNHTFLKKTRESVQNAAYLIKAGYLKTEMRLTKTYFWLKWLGIYRIALKLFKRYQLKIKDKLIFEKPSLKLLDIYKLGLLLLSMAQLSEETKS